ncbi:helix-turn-helix domain-containing protein [Amycolatopsis thailandensis]|uniref:helix-turn-helix domain-containing protein n=1 Tax=Amycolatopsis thailandensis TaxID=589330 RepID=UPI0036487019
MGDVPQTHSNPAELAEKRAEAYRLKLRGLSDRAAAAEMGVSHTTIQNWVRQEADDIVLPLAAELRKVQLERLGEMRQAAIEVLERFHLTVSHGKVIKDDYGDPLEDDGPKLQAIDRLLRIEERIAKLMGLDAPTKAEIEARVEPQPAELQKMLRQARERVEQDEATLRG